MKILSDDANDKLGYLLYRSLVIECSVNKMVDLMDNYEKYKEMLDIISFTMYHDLDFFLLNDYLQKTQSFIRNCSFKFSTSTNVREIENEIICDLNKAKLLRNKEDRIENFFELEQSLRMYLPKNEDDILESVSRDYELAHQLINIEDKEDRITNISCRQFIESSSFFLSSIEEFYKETPLAKELSEKYLKELPIVKDSELKKCIKKVKKELKSI